jgi:hypothetical protein
MALSYNFCIAQFDLAWYLKLNFGVINFVCSILFMTIKRDIISTTGLSLLM